MEGRPRQFQMVKVRHPSQHGGIEPSGFLCRFFGGINVQSSHVLCYRVVSSEERKSGLNSDIVASQGNVAINSPTSYSTKVMRYLRYAKLVIARKVVQDSEPYFRWHGGRHERKEREPNVHVV